MRHIEGGQLIVSYDDKSKKIDHGTIKSISFVTLNHVYKVIFDDGTYFITTADQQCMLYASHQWREVKHQNRQSGKKSPRPIDGQAALDNSFAVEDTNGARVGVSNKQIVILRITRPGLYHGYVVRVNDKSAASAVATLVKNRIIKVTGKFIK